MMRKETEFTKNSVCTLNGLNKEKELFMRKNRVVKKSIVITIILAMIISLISVLAIPIFASETVVHTPFEGYSGDADIEAITNTAKNEDGSYTNPVSTEAPRITVLIPGFGNIY